MEEIKDGVYICKITKIEYKKSKSNKDMISVIFEVSDEDSIYYKKRMYMNQVIDTSFGKHLANEFLRSLDTNLGVDYNDVEELKRLLEAITIAVRFCEYDIKQETKSVFKTYSVVGIYDLVEV